jgi:hypothetical protein
VKGRATLYLDEDVSVVVAEILRNQDVKVLTVHEAGRKGKSDPEQLEFAVTYGYTFVTHNRQDYEDLAREYFEEELKHSGIVVARRRPAIEIARRLKPIVDKYTGAELENQIIYI